MIKALIVDGAVW